MASFAAVNSVLFVVNEATDPSTLAIKSDVLYYGDAVSVPGRAVMSSLLTPVNATDTIAQMGTKLRTSVETEATRLSIVVPTTIFAPDFAKLK